MGIIYNYYYAGLPITGATGPVAITDIALEFSNSATGPLSAGSLDLNTLKTYNSGATDFGSYRGHLISYPDRGTDISGSSSYTWTATAPAAAEFKIIAAGVDQIISIALSSGVYQVRYYFQPGDGQSRTNDGTCYGPAGQNPGLTISDNSGHSYTWTYPYTVGSNTYQDTPDGMFGPYSMSNLNIQVLSGQDTVYTGPFSTDPADPCYNVYGYVNASPNTSTSSFWFRIFRLE
jgi:hypothetical protein